MRLFVKYLSFGLWVCQKGILHPLDSQHTVSPGFVGCSNLRRDINYKTHCALSSALVVRGPGRLRMRLRSSLRILGIEF